MEPNKPKKSFIRHPSWVKVDKKENRVALFCWIIVFFQFMIYLILQCVYLNLQGHSRDREKGVYPSKFKVQIEWIENLMVSIGQIHRADGTTGIFFYALYIAYISIYSLLKLIYGGKLFDLFTKNEILLSMARPDEDRKFVSQRIQNCLDNMIYSNENFTKKFVIHIRSRNPNLDPRLSIKNSEKKSLIKSDKTIIDLCMNLPQLSRITGSFKVQPLLEEKYTLAQLDDDEEPMDFEMLNAEIELYEALLKQHQFLLKLKSNVNRVWPPSRNIQMINKLKNAGLLTFIAYSVFGWTFGQFIAVIANHMAYTSVLGNSRSSSEYGKFKLIDRLVCFESHIINYFIMLSFVPDFCTFFVTVLYQLQQLRNLWSLADKFYESLRRCELWQKKSDCQYLTGSSFLLNEQSRRDLKFECDKNIIELYINYYVFRHEVTSAVKTFESAAGQIISCVIVTLFPVFIYFKYIPKSHWYTLIIIVILVVMLSDFSLLICAFFDSACNRFAKHVWSILALLEGHNYQLYLSSKNSLLTYTLKKNNICETNNFKMFSPEICTSGGQLDYIYYSKSYTNPHSSILWHSLMKSHKAISDGFVVKLYGVYDIDYSGALKFNHWLVWVFLVTLLNQ